MIIDKEHPLHHHRLFVFLGVDIAGSTAFKQGQEALAPPAEGTSGPRWFGAFELFYSTLASVLAQRWPAEAGEPPQLWKASGDELLYRRELTEWHQALIAVDAWRLTIAECREEISAQHPALDLKGTAWVANFPIPNAQIDLPGSQPGSPRIDYLGPSMDTGFRLGSLASPTRLVVSVGLALMMAEALSELGDTKSGCHPRYGEPTVLKGLLSGTPYPAFWVDMRTDSFLAEAEDRLLGKATAALTDIITVCRQKIREKPTHFFEPYIDPKEHPDNKRFNVVYPPHEEALKLLRGRITSG